ncbi:MAG: prepilin-type N-terminal cleavage/methylation domain-containing protein [Lentisphaerae bacterium]|nr:prepilin-type N-terminal cleavage/methylation domain-containing protein [Lentisphaerota bacterium]
MNNPRRGNRQDGFTLIELLVVIVLLIVIAVLLLPNVNPIREKGRRVKCLANLNGIYKTISAWGLNPAAPFRPKFPPGNLVGQISGSNGVITAEGGITPEMFVCPTAAGDYGTEPANTLSSVTASNSSYCYFGGRRNSDGDKIILCDQSGPLTAATPANWGLNHRLNHRDKRGRAKGGNVVKVSGAGMWVSTTNDSLDYGCITNAAIAAMFQTNSDTAIFLY